MPAKLENSAVATGLEKGSLIPIPKKGNVKECSNYCIIVLISHASKVMLKILQARLQQYMNCEYSCSRCSSWIQKFQMFKLDSEKSEEPEIKLPTYLGSKKKQESSRKTSTSALLTMQSLWLCGSQETLEISSKDRNTRPPYLPPEKSVCRSRSNS